MKHQKYLNIIQNENKRLKDRITEDDIHIEYYKNRLHIEGIGEDDEENNVEYKNMEIENLKQVIYLYFLAISNSCKCT